MRSLIWLAAASQVACSAKPVERAPLASDLCGKKVCTTTPRMGISASAPAPENVDAGGVVGTSEQGSLSLDVVMARSADASETEPLGSDIIHLVVDADDGTRTEADYEGSELMLAGVGPAPYWLRLRPDDDTLLITTLLPLAAGQPNASVPVFERRVFEDVANNLSIPVALAADRGHAVLFFTRNDLPLPGVSVAVAEGRVAYDSGTLFSDGLEVTQEHGAAALLNLPAVPFPGGSSEVDVTFLGETVVLDIELCRDAVTLVTVPL